MPYSEEDISAAFKVFDKDGDGKITAKELRAILTHGDSKLTLKETYEIIDDFDADGDGNLDMEEFVKAFAAIGGDAMQNERISSKMYDVRVEKHLIRLKELFNKLDADKSGSLSGDEVRAVYQLATGDVFDAEANAEWYDVNGASDGSFDIKEFGWMIADVAGIDEEEKMITTMNNFENAILEFKRRKQSDKAKAAAEKARMEDHP